jgi:hypothetical protein
MSPLDEEAEGIVKMATSPASYDARIPAMTGGFSAVGPVKDQGNCTTCVAFAVLAAAQSAIASALQTNATSRLSEQDFFFCKTRRYGEERRCNSMLSVADSMERFAELQRENHLLLTERCLPYNIPTAATSSLGQHPAAPSSLCSPNCEETDWALRKGQFSYVQLSTAWDVQEHIRAHGAVVTRLNIWSDFRSFFKANSKGVYPGPGKYE